MATQYEVVIGIEVHAQLSTKTKLFCGCSTAFGSKPNTNVCPVCLGMPGALPVLNEDSVELAIRSGLAMNCDIQEMSVFARKNYFYPDLPKGYQISQFELPICLGGSLAITVPNADGSYEKTIGITRIHMEEDAGKLIHQGADAIAGSDSSLADLNRACTPLIEIVSEPDIRSAAEARAYMETLAMIVKYSGVCDANMEKGNLRADANVSLRPVGQEEFGTRTETKNLNSFRSLERAILYEIQRQTHVLESGGTIRQQTLNYDDSTGKTSVLRDKEDAHDYRYFPDPDLKPLMVTQEQISAIRDTLPELPRAKEARYVDYGLNDQEIKVLLADLDLNAYFENCVKAVPNAESIKEMAKWLVGDFSALVNAAGGSFDTPVIKQDAFLELIVLLKDGTLSGKMAKGILEKMYQTGKTPKALLESSGGGQISDTSELDGIVAQILSANMDVVAKVQGGKTKSADFLMGQVMKETRGRAKPDLVKQLIMDQIAAL
ncbi:Asp-tRNA(Asn)/Glu-tRNA(Gln) amidotransferase subunit GatB [bacterium]|jgi:aspartyl-tRNA(Asn)/glutamyl-tRNA(Gln) amidotransferase subunit B|nr:Asp-tRNA(Asn)/Glu-tRNA(Gln) amidotransferase subunit GatB [bacterium]